jgi:hypothetical protein
MRFSASGEAAILGGEPLRESFFDCSVGPKPPAAWFARVHPGAQSSGHEGERTGGLRIEAGAAGSFERPESSFKEELHSI